MPKQIKLSVKQNRVKGRLTSIHFLCNSLMRQAAAEGNKVRLFHLLPIRFVRYSLSGSFDAGPDSQLHFVIDNNENCQRFKGTVQLDGSD